MFLVVIQHEHTLLKDLLQDPPLNPAGDVPKILHGILSLCAKVSLGEVLLSQFVEDVLLAIQKLEEVQVTVWYLANDWRWSFPKQFFAPLAAIFEEVQATHSRVLDGYVSEPGPSDSLTEIAAEVIVLHT